MRRNMGRRGNIGGNASGSGGPLMTGHLKDIDMELELLKRKREMIEQQQQLLVMEQQFKSSRHYDSYDQIRYDEPETHGSNRDYTYLYENGQKQRNQFGRKRQAETQWQYEGSSKKPPQKRKGNQSSFNPRQGQGQYGPGNTGSKNFRNQRSAPGPSHGSKFFPKAPAPLMGVKVKRSIGQRIANQKQSSKPAKEFTPTKVSKPKASSALNKIAAQPLAERKKLVSAANESVSQVDVSRMLLPDRVPNQQVSGRLELALGAIMKNVRDLIGHNSPHGSMLRSMQLQRVMKQAVRERIRTVMLGKVVGSLLDILEIYRGEFPPETDIDIVNIAREAAGVPTPEREQKTKLIASEDPEDFFKKNMTTLLETNLNEMFAKLEEIYNSNIPAVKSESPENESMDQEGTAKESTGQDGTTQEGMAQEGTTQDGTAQEGTTQEGTAQENMTQEGTAQENMTQEGTAQEGTGQEGTVQDDTAQVGEAQDATAQDSTAQDATAQDSTAQDDTAKDSTAQDGTAQDGTAQDGTAQDGTAQDGTDKKGTALESKVKEGTVQKVTEEKIDQPDPKEYKDFLNSDIKPRDVKRILPRLMKRYIPYIVKLLNVDGMYQSTKAAITMKANQMATKITDKVSAKDKAGNTVAGSATSSDAHQSYNLPYYVKIMGRPTLPKRKSMQTFLNKFNPKSIKKHRSIHNLLFVGFSEKSDFDVMVGADGTVLGRSTLSVRICSKGPKEAESSQNGGNNDTDFALDVGQVGAKKTNVKSEGEVLITADLDCQITDLLSSIRKTEEDETVENPVEGKSGENKPNQNKTKQDEGDVSKDEEMNTNDNEEPAKRDNTAESAKNGLDDSDVIMNDPEVSIVDENTVAANKEEIQHLDENEAVITIEDETEDAEVTEDTVNPTTTEEQCEGNKEDLKSNASGRATPARTSARLATVTPSTVRTRRASRLV